MKDQVFTSGQVARQLGLARWRLLYLVEKGVIPPPSFAVPGRRLFTASDIASIAHRLEERPELRDVRFLK